MRARYSAQVRRTPKRPSRRARQSGAVAVLVGIALLAMVAITGLALDLGKLYVVKSELQNSADACALAAAQELTGANDNQLLLAEAAGATAGGRHKAMFQESAVSYSDSGSIEFSADNGAGSYASAGAVGSAAKSIRYVRCTAVRTGIPTWFIQVLSVLPGGTIDAQQVSATAVATLKPSQSTCSLPVGVCSNATTLVVGHWYMGAVDPNDTTGASQSVFKWIDFTPPSGGASELAEQLRGSGACNVPAANAFVGESGAIASLGNDFNTRFGIYQGNLNPEDAPPDSSGYAYTTTTWTAGSNAFSDFSAKRAANAPYQTDSLTGLKTQGTIKDSNFLKDHGQSRRLMPAPLMDCSNVVNNKMPIASWGCFFLLHPISNNLGSGSGGTTTPSTTVSANAGGNSGGKGGSSGGGNGGGSGGGGSGGGGNGGGSGGGNGGGSTQYPRMMLEYLGDASSPNSPCASYGLPGGSNASGPPVATLVK